MSEEKSSPIGIIVVVAVIAIVAAFFVGKSGGSNGDQAAGNQQKPTNGTDTNKTTPPAEPPKPGKPAEPEEPAFLKEGLVVYYPFNGNAIVVPWDRPVALKISSMDVIHSFKVLPIRVCKDAIPGLQLPIHFKINPEHLKDSEGKSMNGKLDEHIYLITCAQLCGDGHGYMNGYIKAVHPEKFDDWLKEQSQSELKKRVDAKKDFASK